MVFVLMNEQGYQFLVNVIKIIKKVMTVMF